MPVEPVATTSFRSPVRWSLAAAFALAVVALSAGSILAWPERPIDAGVMFFLLALLTRFSYREAWLMETRPEGLYVRYTFGNAKLIPYDQIRRLTVRIDRLQIHTDHKHNARTSIGLGFGARGRPNPAEPLIAAIAQAAGLTKVSTSFLGWPTYDRE